MNTIWLKIVGFVVIIIVVIIGVSMILPANDKKPPEPEKTFQKMVEKDRKIITAQPDVADLAPEKAGDSTEKTTEEPAEPVTFYFTELDMVDKIQAEQIFSAVPNFKSIGRLPALGYRTMTDSCYRLIKNYPGSIFDYKARRALAQVPKQYWSRYKITDELVDLSPFTIQRQNTYPYNPEEDY